MVNKAFQIQGADLSLGGVSLQAGTTGVVIPGISQATNYTVDEVEDTGDQTDTLQGAVAILDAVQFNALTENTSANIATYATYTVQLDDEFFIDSIEVDSAGSYTQQESDTNSSNDMWAPGVSGDPFASFNPDDWFQVPFRPKMRAGEIENIGGGGSNSGDTISAGDYEFVLNSDGSIAFPTLSTTSWDDGTLTGPTLRMGNDPESQVIITGPTPDGDNINAQRLVIQGQQGFGGENNSKGEGGDVYLWAGSGGDGGAIDPRGDGGDVKLRGGLGGTNGGYIRIESGDAQAESGSGGFLDLTAGNATNTNGQGGNVNIRAGNGASANQSGSVIIYTNNGEWTFGQYGALSTSLGTVQRDITSVSCNHGVDTVVYTSTAHNRHTIKLLLNVEGNVVDNQSGWDTQSCEMIVTKSFRGPTVAATVYAVVHTSAEPLATFAAQWNAVTSRVEVTCRPTSSTQDVYVKSFVTEITTSD